MNGNLKEKNNKGFSLLELVVVVAVLAILAVIGGPLFLKIINFARFETAKNHLRESFTSCINEPNVSPTNPNIPGVTFQSSNCSSLMSATIDNSCTISMDMATGIKTGWTKSYDACVTPNIAKSNGNSKPQIKNKLQFSSAHEISSNLDAPMHVELGDMDGDGDLDFVVTSIYDGAVRWFENDGSGKPSFTAHDVITDDGFKYGVSLADMDGDGDMDIVSSGNKLTWYENDGSPNPSYTPRDIPKVGGTGREIALADMDGDGDMDIVDTSGSSDTVKWYENDGRGNPSFKEISIDTDSNGAQDVHVDDIDGDGDMDIIVAAQDAGTVEWYENKGGSNPNWGKTLIASDLESVTGVSVADIDGDGDLDILSSSQGDSKIAWYENNGRSDPAFKSQNIAVDPPGPVQTDINGNPPAENVGYAADVRVADMDGDGDLDVITSNYEGTYHVYKNDGSSNPSWDKNVLAQRSRRNVQLFEMGHGDIDGDGDIDVVGVSRYEGSVFWYESE